MEAWDVMTDQHKVAEEAFKKHLDACLATLARLYARDGAAFEVAVLANSHATFEAVDFDNWNGGTYGYQITLTVTPSLYCQLEAKRSALQKSFLERFQPLLEDYNNHSVNHFSIRPDIKADENWREKAKAWLAGSGVNNQGRVRSDNIATKECDGLLFRSQEEVCLYKALKPIGVSFAPLPVFVRGGKDYHRIEPDFLLVKDGITMVVEVDGDTVHRELPSEAHARTSILGLEGVHIERVSASDCRTQEQAEVCAKKMLGIIEKLKTNR